MSNYHGRRAPNVSQYLANLNTIPSEVPAQDEFPIGADLDFLTNTEFFDFDNFDTVGGDFPAGGAQGKHASSKSAGAGGTSLASISTAHKQYADQYVGPGYQFGEFQTYPTMTNSPSSNAASPTASALQGSYPPQPPHFGSVHAGDKRKSSVAGIPSAADLEEASRMAAEEDKRRRNTAASARFRVKKKQREQALEKQAKEMTDKVTALEGKVQQLEMENKWLKELITEKQKDSEKKAAEERKGAKEDGERSTEGRTDGVGTSAEEAEVGA
jgi:hypothetical protein